METPYGNQPRPAIALPNATLVLVMGILSIIFSCCFTPVGLILAIIGLVFNSKDQALYRNNPDAYQKSSYNNLQVGRILSIIGLVLSVMFIIFAIYYYIAFGSMFWEQYMHQMRQMNEA